MTKYIQRTMTFQRGSSRFPLRFIIFDSFLVILWWIFVKADYKYICGEAYRWVEMVKIVRDNHKNRFLLFQILHFEEFVTQILKKL